jgi:hypothetical protein
MRRATAFVAFAIALVAGASFASGQGGSPSGTSADRGTVQRCAGGEVGMITTFSLRALLPLEDAVVAAATAAYDVDAQTVARNLQVVASDNDGALVRVENVLGSGVLELTLVRAGDGYGVESLIHCVPAATVPG